MSWECTIEATTVREPWLSRNLPRIPTPHEPLGAPASLPASFNTHDLAGRDAGAPRIRKLGGPNARKVFGAISPLPHGRGLG